MENLFDELKRFVHFDAADEAALRGFAPLATAHFPAITEAFYAHIHPHEHARMVFSGPDQIARLKGTLREWLERFMRGPWDDDYFERRQRIGHVHVAMKLPQRYMFAAMNVVRAQLLAIAETMSDAAERFALSLALHKLIDIELAIMLESYSQAQLAQVQRAERLERESLARQLACTEASYDEVVEKAEALITTTDASGRIVLFNAKCEQLTGSNRASMKGASWLEVFVDEADRGAVEIMRREALAGHAGRSYEGPVRTITGNHRVRWHFTTLPGAATMCAIGVDVTNEHELAVRTRRAERLASLGTMAAGLAHEIRNPLNSANLQLSVARRRLLRGSEVDQEVSKRALDLAETEMKRLALLVEDFLAFARPQPLRLVPTDLCALASTVLSLVSTDAHSAGVTLELAPSTPVEVELDVDKIKQVLLNLYRNAIEAVESGGHVRVKVERSEYGARLSVEDDGPGVAADAPIFEPFYTTKDHGTGLGLSIVHRIVMDHGGTIGIQSQPGHTVFSLALPGSGANLAVGPGPRVDAISALACDRNQLFSPTKIS